VIWDVTDSNRTVDIVETFKLTRHCWDGKRTPFQNRTGRVWAGNSLDNRNSTGQRLRIKPHIQYDNLYLGCNRNASSKTPTGLACYQTATFNTTTCIWDVTEIFKTPAPTGLTCYRRYIQCDNYCVWDSRNASSSSGNLLSNHTFNTTTCIWDVTET
jgi:hypothetical protein